MLLQGTLLRPGWRDKGGYSWLTVRRAWRLKVRKLAAWHPPRNVQLGTEPPVRDPASVKLEGKARKRVSHQQQLDTAGKRIQNEFLQTCAFLRVEDREGGREAFGQKLIAAVQNAFGQDDISNFEQLCDVASGDWVMDMWTQKGTWRCYVCVLALRFSRFRPRLKGREGPHIRGLHLAGFHVSENNRRGMFSNKRRPRRSSMLMRRDGFVPNTGV